LEGGDKLLSLSLSRAETAETAEMGVVEEE
jgi:hypothetical protein